MLTVKVVSPDGALARENGVAAAGRTGVVDVGGVHFRTSQQERLCSVGDVVGDVLGNLLAIRKADVELDALAVDRPRDVDGCRRGEFVAAGEVERVCARILTVGLLADVGLCANHAWEHEGERNRHEMDESPHSHKPPHLEWIIGAPILSAWGRKNRHNSMAVIILSICFHHNLSI